MRPTWGHLLGPEKHLSEPGNRLLIADKITLGSAFWFVSENSAWRAYIPILLSVGEVLLRIVPQFAGSAMGLHLSNLQKPRLKEEKRQVQSSYWSGRLLLHSHPF